MCHTQEAVEEGRLDSLKGSFYANPMQDNEDMAAHLREQCPSYCRQELSCLGRSSCLCSAKEQVAGLSKRGLSLGLSGLSWHPCSHTTIHNLFRP